MLLLVKTVFPERTVVGICLMIALAIDTFETVWTRFFLLDFKFWQIYFKVHFAVLHKMLMMFSFVWTIAFNTF